MKQLKVTAWYSSYATENEYLYCMYGCSINYDNRTNGTMDYWWTLHFVSKKSAQLLQMEEQSNQVKESILKRNLFYIKIK